MLKLKSILIPAAAAAMVFGASAAQAQMGWAPGRHNMIANQIEELDRRIDRADDRNRISEREAAGLRREVRNLRYQYRDFRRDGLTRWEWRTLQRRIDDVRTRLRIERSDWDNRRW
jgi:predicted RNase H-like nuclease (RuvC/YqgF family)